MLVYSYINYNKLNCRSTDTDTYSKHITTE